MARVYKQPSLVSGLSVKDILNMDITKFNSLTEKDMRKVVGRLVSAGNKRLRSFERAGESSPATRYILDKSGGVFSTKGKNLQQLRSEYMRAKGFLESKTGNRKGWAKVKKETIETLETKGIHMTDEQWERFWKSYEKLKQLDKSVAEKEFKYTTLDNVIDYVRETDMEPEDIATTLKEKLDNIYEEHEVLNNEFTKYINLGIYHRY